MNTLTVSQVNRYIKAILDEAQPLNRIYVSGEISDISELEENLIDPICREEADKNSICYQGYRVNSTVNVL